MLVSLAPCLTSVLCYRVESLPLDWAVLQEAGLHVPRVLTCVLAAVAPGDPSADTYRREALCLPALPALLHAEKQSQETHDNALQSTDKWIL